jgi:TPR repeat protein
LGKCPFCKAEIIDKTEGEKVEELKKRVEANDAGAIYMLGNYYYHCGQGIRQDQAKAIELYTRAADLGYCKAHFELGNHYDAEGNSKKERFHYEAAAMAGHEAARCNLGSIEGNSGNIKQAIRHFMIAASAGHYIAMNNLIIAFKQGLVSRNAMDSTLTAYNNSCAEMRSEARDKYISFVSTNMENRV